MGQIETRGPQAARSCSACSQRRRQASPSAAPQYACSAARTAACSTTSSAYRLEAERCLTVTNASNHERDSSGSRPRRRARRRVADARERWAMLAIQGPARARLVQSIADAPLPPATPSTSACSSAAGRSSAAPATRRGRRRGARRPRDAGASGTEVVRRGATPRRPRRPRHAAPRGVPAAVRQTTLSEDARPIEAASAGAARRTPLHRLRRRPRRARGRPVRAQLARSGSRAGIPRPGIPVAGGGVVTSGTMSPCLGMGIGMAYVPAERAAPAPSWRSTSAARPAPRCGQEAALPQGADGRRAATPRTCSTTRARLGQIDGDDATFGITWYAQDALGEVVFFDPPEVGSTRDQGRALRRGRVGQGGLGRRSRRCPARSSRSTRRSATARGDQRRPLW
jgi:aminomethyltransferase